MGRDNEFEAAIAEAIGWVDWSGLATLAHDPAIAVVGGKVYVSWNGATEVKRWQVLVGNANDDLAVVATATKNGFETAIRFHVKGKFIAVQALDGKGEVIGVSRTLKLEH